MANPFSDRAVVNAVNAASRANVDAIGAASRAIVAAIGAASAACARQLSTIVHNQEQMMTNQEQLNQKVSILALNVQDAVEAIKSQPGAEALDFSGLDAAIEALDAATPEVDRTPRPEQQG